MLILSLTSSQKQAGAALIENGEVLRALDCDMSMAHSETLVPAVRELMRMAKLEFEQLDAVAADAGPGSFTGVRICVCTANALAFAANKPVIAVSSLDGLRHNAAEDGYVCALIDSRNGNGYGALYFDGEIIIPSSAVVIADFVREIPKNTLFLGDGAVLHRGLIEANTAGARFLEGEKNRVSAAGIGIEGCGRFMRGEWASEAMPLYLRPSQAERLYDGTK